MQEFFQKTFYNNSVFDYMLALIFFIAGTGIIWIFRTIVIRRLKKIAEKTETEFDDFILANISALVPPLYYAAFYFSIQHLELGSAVDSVIRVASMLVILYFSVRIILSLITFSLEKFQEKRGGPTPRRHAVKGIVTVARLVVWSFALIIFLDNLGVKITALVTGLGIGGIAIALAAQTILADLFSYFTIFFDRPFEIDDFIIIGDFMGTVEHIGIKTSRVRSLGGEELVFSNTDITNSRLRNYRRMNRRRIIFSVGVTYSTTTEQLKMIPGLVKEIVDAIEIATFDRCHFSAFGNFSQDIETVYFIESRDYNIYMDVQQEINLGIREAFVKNGIEFAFPTQTVYLEKE